MNMNKNVIILTITVVVLGMVGYGLYISFSDPTVMRDTEYLDEELTTAPDAAITTDDILSNPSLYDGMTVNLRAEVEDWLSPRAFILDAPGLVDDNLLVITNEPTFIFEDPELFGDSIWEVTGTVNDFELVVARDTLDVDLNPDIFTLYEGRPYIVADSVELYED